MVSHDIIESSEKVYARVVYFFTQLKPPLDAFSFVELILDKSGELAEVSREAAQNVIGMVAWRMKIKQPELGQRAREIIVIANDSTVEQG